MGWEIRLTVQGGLRILERIEQTAATFSGSVRSWVRARLVRIGRRALFM
jgi:hypothetical protein